VSIPRPVFLSFGMPPAKMPPSCGAAVIPPEFPPPPSLLLLALFPAPPGTGGARPPGGFSIPGIGGAPPIGGPPELPDSFATSGADRSFVVAFFRRVPFVISVRRAPWRSH
jgi:hypothetical protein